MENLFKPISVSEKAEMELMSLHYMNLSVILRGVSDSARGVGWVYSKPYLSSRARPTCQLTQGVRPMMSSDGEIVRSERSENDLRVRFLPMVQTNRVCSKAMPIRSLRIYNESLSYAACRG